MPPPVTPPSPARQAGRRSPSIVVAAVLVTLAVLLAGCSGTATSQGDADDPAGDGAAGAEAHERRRDHGAAGRAGAQEQQSARIPLREGERRMRVAMPEPYRPAAPTASGIDDYRCFLLDPGIADDVMVTGTDVVPGDPSMVHHVILFQVPPEQVPAARAVDDASTGQGWTCFGGSGVSGNGPVGGLGAPWLGAWTPGSSESMLHDGYGIPLAAGSQLVMQVHYSLLGGGGADVTSTELRLSDAAGLAPVSAMGLPAPVELPCRPEYADGPLCDRPAALADVRARFGAGPGSTAQWLLARCGARPGPEQSCATTFAAPGTIIGVAGHMHLLGRSIRVEVNPGTDQARTILDIPTWNFDQQGAVPIEPLDVAAGDTVTVTCEHDQALRDHLPAFEGQPDRYVLWGEGTTDEMCAGILQVAS